MERLEPARGVTGGGRRIKHEKARARRDGTGGMGQEAKRN